MVKSKFLNQVVDKCRSFKIGKTSLDLEDRRNEPDYIDTYSNIASLYKSGNKILVSVAESQLIDSFIDHPKCDNTKDGDESLNDSMGDGDVYQVYIVWR